MTSTISALPKPHLAEALPAPAPAELPRLSELHGRGGHAYRCAERPLGGAAKRALDVMVSATALVALAPALAAIAMAIRLDGPGPIFFRQRRAGFRGRVFRIYKFRTMTAAEDGRNVQQAQRGDPRVTRVGRILRRTSLDELPQLINVLLGDMSVVGPRPHAIVHEHEFGRHDETYRLRRLARPGITGLAQVSGARGVTDTEEKIQRRIALDLQYVRAWSLGLDLKILLKTVRVVLNDPEAF